jgi:hypothetical protein
MFENIAVYDCKDWHEAFVFVLLLSRNMWHLHLMCGETASCTELEVVCVPCAMGNFLLIPASQKGLHIFHIYIPAGRLGSCSASCWRIF